LEPRPQLREQICFLEVDVNQLGLTFFVLSCGTVGAVLSVALLLIIPTDDVHNGFQELIANDLLVLVFATGMGSGIGALVALLWLVLLRLFAANAPRV
jgi:hypothetical protein